MSADEMPCGCWGHADYEERCRYPKLEQDLSAERKRREGLEEELHLERLAHTAAVTRAEQAERERDRLHEHVKATINGPFGPEVVLLREGLNLTGWAERADRAEADNLALLDVIRQMKDDDAWGSEHPGAALLERIRALEKMREACEPWVRHARDGKSMTEDGLRVVAACEAYDAIKEMS